MSDALKQAAKQALEALEEVDAPEKWPFAVKQDTCRAIEALRAALSAPHPAAPVPAKAVQAPLTTRQVISAFQDTDYGSYETFKAGVRFAECLHGIRQPGSDEC
jgi:hypothetical protein